MGISDPTDKQPSCNEFVAATNLGINDHYRVLLICLPYEEYNVKRSLVVATTAVNSVLPSLWRDTCL
jgi:hypothetical protein